MDRKKNRQVHNTYWSKVFNIIKEVNEDIVSLEDLCFFITYCEIQNKFSLNVNTFDMNSLSKFVISNGYKPKYKSLFEVFRKEKKELISKKIPADVSQIVANGS